MLLTLVWTVLLIHWTGAGGEVRSKVRKLGVFLNMTDQRAGLTVLYRKQNQKTHKLLKNGVRRALRARRASFFGHVCFFVNLYCFILIFDTIP